MTSPTTARIADPAEGWTRSPLGLYVPPRPRRRYTHPVAIDLFAGAGGFSCGFHQAGFHVAAAMEYDIDAALTYMVNLARPGVRIHCDTPEREQQLTAALEHHYGLTKKRGRKVATTVPHDPFKRGYMTAGSGWIANRPASEPGCEHFFLGDIRNFTGQQILDALGLDVGDVTCIMGGPPCQGYSAAGKQNVMDPRNSLVFEFARLVCEIQPHTFVMENVPRIASMVTPEGIPVLDALALAVSEGGYGAYDALRKSLWSHPDARAATRKKATADRKRKAEPPADPEDDQAALFDLESAS
jgi:DNA (cytosine-5)-methyltransferase 1